MTIDKDGALRCRCGEVADVLMGGRWTCVDCAGRTGRVVREEGAFADGPRRGSRWVRWMVYLDGKCLGATNSEDEGWRWIDDMRKMAGRCRVCGGTGGQHDGATHDARSADLPADRVRPTP